MCLVEDYQIEEVRGIIKDIQQLLEGTARYVHDLKLEILGDFVRKHHSDEEFGYYLGTIGFTELPLQQTYSLLQTGIKGGDLTELEYRVFSHFAEAYNLVAYQENKRGNDRVSPLDFDELKTVKEEVKYPEGAIAKKEYSLFGDIFDKVKEGEIKKLIRKPEGDISSEARDMLRTLDNMFFLFAYALDSSGKWGYLKRRTEEKREQRAREEEEEEEERRRELDDYLHYWWDQMY